MKIFSNGRHYLRTDGPTYGQIFCNIYEDAVKEDICPSTSTKLNIFNIYFNFTTKFSLHCHFIISPNLNAGKSAPTGKLTLSGIAAAKSSIGGKSRGISIGLHL